ncbi:MAG: rhamnulokinase [Clostridia bacterium]|nr:rhamnulokinase [Clostridia bacterium]
MEYYLAVDIGASGGRHVLGWIEGGRMRTREVYRFENRIENAGGSLVWDFDRLVSEVENGLKRCAELGFVPKSVAIDTWGVDYVLLGADGRIICPVYCYRDGRTESAVPAVEVLIPPEELYARTGIQKQQFNTIFQLYADKLAGRLDRAEHMLMLPSYITYKLTGVMQNEYTDATTTGLVNALSGEWDGETIRRLDLPERLFGALAEPCMRAGWLLPEVAERVGFDCEVIFAPSHDTASAVAGCPIKEGEVYISSGTWSLIGVETPSPVLSETARAANFTNEGGVERRFRLLKNYTGMWLMQSIRRELGGSMTYDEMMEAARSCCGFTRIDVTDPRLLAPESMLAAVRSCASEAQMPLDRALNTVYHSLAASYAEAVAELEGVAGFKASAIRVVGGGSRDVYLNELTEKYTGLPVKAGPVEATSTGNLLSQIMFDKKITLAQARELTD